MRLSGTWDLQPQLTLLHHSRYNEYVKRGAEVCCNPIRDPTELLMLQRCDPRNPFRNMGKTENELEEGFEKFGGIFGYFLQTTL